VSTSVDASSRSGDKPLAWQSSLPLSRGQASISTSRLASGDRRIKAEYKGEGKCRGSSGELSQTVNGPGASAVGLDATLTTDRQSVELRARISCGDDATGTIRFYEGTSNLPNGDAVKVDPSASSAPLTTSNLSAGSHTFGATYSGDGKCAAGKSRPLTVVVPVVAPSQGASGVTVLTGELSSNRAPGFVAAVTCGGKPAEGTVSLYDGQAAIPANEYGNTLYQGVKRLSLPTDKLSAGSHSISAAYAGAANCPASRSPALTVIVPEAGPSSTRISSSTNPSTAGGYVTFTATVTCGDDNPSEWINFFDGQSMLVEGVVGGEYSTAGLAPGSHSIIANYMGNKHCAPSTSEPITQVVSDR
jgi:hypothetical protein